MPRAQPKPKKNAGPRGKPGDYEEIEIANKLLEKVGPGVGASSLALARAERVVEKMKDAYEERMGLEIDELLATYEKMQIAGAYDLDALHDRAHEIRGEAGTFGYNLVSDISKLFCELLSPMEEVGTNEKLAIRAHLNAMQTVASQKITGAGPEVAKQVVEGLNTIVAKSHA
jgi:HPt (histidine-containing phosphotransfer) domain-containing protein